MQNALTVTQPISRRAQLRTLWKVLRLLAQDPRRLGNLIDHRAEERAYVTQTYGLGDGLPTVDLLDLLPGFEETVEPVSFLEGTSLLTDLALLKALARRFPQCRYLEIGAWRGESVANVASVAAACVSISLSADEMRQSGYHQELIAAHGFYSKSLPNITHIGHDSRTFDYASLPEKFDLIFVDGDHTHDSVRIDTQNAFKMLRGPDAMIVWHDYGHTRYSIQWHILAGILDGCPPAQRPHLYHVSNTLCAIYSPQPLPAAIVQTPQIPTKTFRVSLSAIRT
ncbi:MAG: class I SAM-dependent methyltransferase [Anaerolineae bacterium]